MAPLAVLANLTFLNLGFIVGSIAKTVQAASGLGNAVAMPMMFLSGVFFPTENLPTILARVVAYLSLSPMLEAMRGVLWTRTRCTSTRRSSRFWPRGWW